jgi:hypothetical protein
MSNEPTPIQKGQPPSQERLDPLQQLEELKKGQLLRIEEAAKYLAAVITIALTLLIDKGLADWTTETFKAAAVLWLLAAVVSFVVLLPLPYQYLEDQPESIAAAVRRMGRWKYAALLAATILFLVGLFLAVVGFWQG